MTEDREYRVIILEDADKNTMLKEQYRLSEMLCDEWNVHDECDEIDKKLEALDDYHKRISRVENGFKNRKR